MGDLSKETVVAGGYARVEWRFGAISTSYARV